MNWRNTPYVQIAQVIGRSLGPQDARWLYFAITCVVVITVAGGGLAMQWGVAALIKSIIGLIIFSLQFVGMWVLTALMRMNHPVASHLVPGYVRALRRSALAIWLGICLISGLTSVLDGRPLGNFIPYAFLAGAAMLLICAPMRWPIQWSLFIVGFVWFSRHSFELFDSGPLHALIRSKLATLALVSLIFAGMGWLITRLIATRGNAYASVFSRFLGAQNPELIVDQPVGSTTNKRSLWFKTYRIATSLATQPWRRYANHMLASPKPNAANLVARAELGFGPMVHWVTQVSFSVGFAVLVLAIWWVDPNSLLEAGGKTSPLTTFHVGLMSVVCATTAVLYIGDVMLRTQGEQKLMLLLPGMQRGNALNQTLAVRHLRQAFAAWVMASAWALVLPYPGSAATYVAAFCWGTLPLVPLVLRDWAEVRPPSADRAVLSLMLALLVPFSAWAALRWLQLPVALLAAIAVGACLLVLRIRLSRLAHSAQAFPVGRSAKCFK
ncbi:MAG: hypothetical protein CFE44_06310 [Burkholderiales bacterium PBB4]|nr:MAG: hypothetical protein CFE44_06310 [Burkholderiales bacterium PBB4]